MKFHPTNSEKFRTEKNQKWVCFDKIPLSIVPKIKKIDENNEKIVI